ncbi:MAG: hypothetical protein IJN42_01730 [Clostridia bacterium]|nr:hypothetical protein [Clostridia bacterium]MBQ6946741.1 hypothetical protein [Clostridia bacterium]
MKRSKQIALCGVLSSLAVVIMLLAYFPYMTFALPAVAGILLCIVFLELNYKWAVGAYVCAAIITLLLCEKEAAVLFVGVFGYYPIVKIFLEKIPVRPLVYFLKFLLFNVAIVVAYLVIIFVFHIPIEDMGAFGKYTLFILLGLGNVMFFVYDLALSRVIAMYLKLLHPRVRHILR